VGIPSWYVTNQLSQLSLHPSGVAKSSTNFGWGKGRNVTSAGWQITLCDSMSHVSSHSSVATLRTAVHLLLTYFVQGSDVDVMRKRAERFGEVTSTQLGKVGRVKVYVCSSKSCVQWPHHGCQHDAAHICC